MIPYYGSQFSGKGGHYESWFIRANDPQQPRGFWVRYTQFIPADGFRKPLGEIWAIWFDDNSKQVIAVKEEFPLEECQFHYDDMSVRIGSSTLSNRAADGTAALGENTLSWSLQHDGGQAPLLLLPDNLYKGGFPKAKSLVSYPNAVFSGRFTVNGETHDIRQWQGSENHNWGSQHTNQYAWGQVAGFDDHPEAFLECASAKVKIGPLNSPWMSLACLRIGEQTFEFNRIPTALKAKQHYGFFHWQLDTKQDGNTLRVNIQAPISHFIGLTYFNPPGGNKTCLNSKIAQCQVQLTPKTGKPITMTSAHGAAFEILTDQQNHGVPLAT